MIASLLIAALLAGALELGPPVDVPKRAEQRDELLQEVRDLRQRLTRLENASRLTPLPAVETTQENASIKTVGYLSELHGRNQSSYGHRLHPAVRWSGFMQLDAGAVSQTQGNIAAVGDIESKVGLRRVRLRADGQLQKDTSYVVDLDFAASGHPSFRDVKFTLHDQGWFQNLQLGYFQQPFGFDAMTSGRELLLLERQLPFAFVPFRQTGVGAYGTALDETVSWAASGFRFPTDAFGVSQGESGGWGLAGRMTALPFINEEKAQLVHVGTSYSFINPGQNIVRYAIEPGFFVVDPSDQSNATNIPVFVDTGDLPTENVNLAGIELASQWGSLNMQAEAIGAFVNQSNSPFASFHGVSAKLAYVLTGEIHPYDPKQGVFTRVMPNVKAQLGRPLTGAWEAVGGWSMIDLNDGGVTGGRMQTFILGLNRYLNQHTKFQFNLIRALLDSPAMGESAATLAVVRAQAEF